MYGRFRFHPIGQGLFYTGSIFHSSDRPYNFVYDCGEEYNRNCLIDAIDKHVSYLDYHDKRANKTQPIIDFVVISHLDYDHVVGIYDLQKKAKIRKYYLPYIGETSNPSFQYVFDFLLYNIDGENTEISVEAIEWFRGLYEKGEMIEGAETENDNEALFDEETQERVYIINTTSSSVFYGGNRLWCFHLFNKKVDPKAIKQFEVDVRAKFGTTEPRVLLRDITKRNELNDIYIKVFGDSNITSLVLAHYPLREAITQICCKHYPGTNSCSYCDCFLLSHFRRCRHCHYCEGAFPSALTVLTGDANFDTKTSPDMLKTLKGILDSKPSHIKILQVPHHGSNEKKNRDWDSLGALKMAFDWYVISFGYGNSHGHPHNSVVSELHSASKDFVFVTQIGFFEYKIACR